MRNAILLALVAALAAPAAWAQMPTEPDAGPGTGAGPPTEPGDETIPPDDTGAPPQDSDVFVDQDAEASAPFGLAWWAWLLLALVVVGIIAAVAIAMGSRERTMVVDRGPYRPPPP